VFLFTFASTLSAQLPKETPKVTPPAAEELKAREAFLAGKIDDSLKLLQAAVKTNPALSPPKVILARWFVDVRQGKRLA